jgi:methylglutaconyl-CoA hydratase
MSDTNHTVETGTGGVARVMLDRPGVHNALDDRLIADLAATFRRLGADPAVRAIVLTGRGPSFCAGGDLNWMKRSAGYSFDQNVADAVGLAEMLRAVDTAPKPVLGLVNGPAYGGGVGLVACCDIVLAADTAKFTLSEVRLGLVPATISPYVVGKIGAGQARRYFLSAEIFGAEEARRIGLVHEVVPAAELEAAGARMQARLAEGGPAAQSASKDLIFRVAARPIERGLMADTARRIAEARASAEGQEGIAAFLGKRKPNWREG